MWRRIQYGHMAKERTLGLMLKDYTVKMTKYPFFKNTKFGTVIIPQVLQSSGHACSVKMVPNA